MIQTVTTSMLLQRKPLLSYLLHNTWYHFFMVASTSCHLSVAQVQSAVPLQSPISLWGSDRWSPTYKSHQAKPKLFPPKSRSGIFTGKCSRHIAQIPEGKGRESGGWRSAWCRRRFGEGLKKLNMSCQRALTPPKVKHVLSCIQSTVGCRASEGILPLCSGETPPEFCLQPWGPQCKEEVDLLEQAQRCHKGD